MKTRTRAQSLFLATPLPLFLAVLIFNGCGENIERNPTFRKQVKTIERLDEDSKVLDRRVEDVTISLTTLRREMRDLKKAPQLGGNALQAMDARFDALENQMKASNKAMSAIQGQLNDLKKRPTQFASNTKSNASRSRSSKRIAKASDASQVLDEPDAPSPRRTKATASLSRSRRSSRVVEEPFIPKGFYHLVLRGETVGDIARQHGLRSQAILMANRIPSGREPFAGQQIYIPTIQ